VKVILDTNVLMSGVLVDDVPLTESVSRDADDDKFLACAVSSGTPIVITGDDLLEVDGYKGIEILKPRGFVDRYMKLAAFQGPRPLHAPAVRIPSSAVRGEDRATTPGLTTRDEPR
jgi:predicted nucleic acid-binding protein